ncbi:hypothetical protein CSUI_002667 [Cystoisospora suis]|uniref:Uncharacterized protein n=1 Tax=Cystoisospora suis TaxID=483139 RepID=A0A2C6L779_9APIC|nr:hypothetical protein CSUI_002667 [Cystoisospora suis]
MSGRTRSPPSHTTTYQVSSLRALFRKMIKSADIRKRRSHRFFSSSSLCSPGWHSKVWLLRSFPRTYASLNFPPSLSSFLRSSVILPSFFPLLPLSLSFPARLSSARLI